MYTHLNNMSSYFYYTEWRKDEIPQRKRFLYTHQYARDYTYAIFERYVRIYGFLHEKKACDFLDKVKTRWNWDDCGAHIHIPNNHILSYIEVQGDFCPIGYPGYMDKYRYLIETCSSCGENKELIKGSIVKKPDRHAPWRWLSSSFFPYQINSRCTNQHCREVKQYMKGKHPLVKPGRKNKVLQKRPLNEYKRLLSRKFVWGEENPKILAYAMGSIGLLNFEARYIDKINNQTGETT